MLHFIFVVRLNRIENDELHSSDAQELHVLQKKMSEVTPENIPLKEASVVVGLHS